MVFVAFAWALLSLVVVAVELDVVLSALEDFTALVKVLLSQPATASAVSTATMAATVRRCNVIRIIVLTP